MSSPQNTEGNYGKNEQWLRDLYTYGRYEKLCTCCMVFPQKIQNRWRYNLAVLFLDVSTKETKLS